MDQISINIDSYIFYNKLGVGGCNIDSARNFPWLHPAILPKLRNINFLEQEEG